jgi:hypothetical protein
MLITKSVMTVIIGMTRIAATAPVNAGQSLEIEVSSVSIVLLSQIAYVAVKQQVGGLWSIYIDITLVYCSLRPTTRHEPQQVDPGKPRE